MSPKRKGESSRADGPLSAEQERAWVAYMRIHLRLTYEMNRQLQADTGLSLADYHVLNALRHTPGERLQINPLAARIGWERSRLSHHVRRLSARGLVGLGMAAGDRRATEVTLTDDGRRAITGATQGHHDLIRRLFFGGLPADLLAPLTAALECVYESIIETGSLPRPVGED